MRSAGLPKIIYYIFYWFFKSFLCHFRLSSFIKGHGYPDPSGRTTQKMCQPWLMWLGKININIFKYFYTSKSNWYVCRIHDILNWCICMQECDIYPSSRIKTLTVYLVMHYPPYLSTKPRNHQKKKSIVDH